MAALASRPRRHRFATKRLRNARAQTASYTACGDMNRLLERRSGNKGKREFIQVLRLMEVFDQDLVARDNQSETPATIRMRRFARVS